MRARAAAGHIGSALLHTVSLAHTRALVDRKRTLFESLSGVVLEVGPGTGTNIAFLPRDVRWIGLEPNRGVHGYLRRALRRAGRTPADSAVVVVDPDRNRIPAPDATFDAVIATLVWCSVDDPAVMLAEVIRVLKPGGRFIAFEHVAAPAGTRLRRVQEKLAPWWWRTAHCRVVHDLKPVLAAAGFTSLDVEDVNLSVAGPFGPQLVAVAVR